MTQSCVALATVDRTTECGGPALGVEGLDLQLGDDLRRTRRQNAPAGGQSRAQGSNFGARGTKTPPRPLRGPLRPPCPLRFRADLREIRLFEGLEPDS